MYHLQLVELHIVRVLTKHDVHDVAPSVKGVLVLESQVDDVEMDCDEVILRFGYGFSCKDASALLGVRKTNLVLSVLFPTSFQP